MSTVKDCNEVLVGSRKCDQANNTWNELSAGPTGKKSVDYGAHQ